MDTGKNKSDIFDLLIEQEEQMARLYLAYQNRLPDHRDFWGQLVVEENAHANVLIELSQTIDNHTVFFDQRKFNAIGLKGSIDYIRKQIDIANAGPVTALRALATAYDLETTLIEKEFFTVVMSDSVKIKTEFQTLQDHTHEHRQRIAIALNDERARQNR
jgi:hypothetical protein